MRYFHILMLLQLGISSYAQSESDSEAITFKLDSIKATIKTKLNVPFGTITKLNVEIFDGDKLQMKRFSGIFLLKVNSINDKPLIDTVLLTFVDETGQLANNDFELYKLTYRKQPNSISGSQSYKLKQKYVGKKFIVMAYETGQFSGMPKEYTEFRPSRDDTDFHFLNYLIVVSNLTKKY